MAMPDCLLFGIIKMVRSWRSITSCARKSLLETRASKRSLPPSTWTKAPWDTGSEGSGPACKR